MSIADTLHDAIAEIDDYLNPDGEGGPYTATPEYAGIVYVRDLMEVLRCVLDIDPDGYLPTARFHEDSERSAMPPYSLFIAVHEAARQAGKP